MLSFFDLSELNTTEYSLAMQAYRDAAMIKGLYFKMFVNVRWLLRSSQHIGMKESSISTKIAQFIG
jgi:hypothetical protein